MILEDEIGLRLQHTYAATDGHVLHYYDKEHKIHLELITRKNSRDEFKKPERYFYIEGDHNRHWDNLQDLLKAYNDENDFRLNVPKGMELDWMPVITTEGDISHKLGGKELKCVETDKEIIVLFRKGEQPPQDHVCDKMGCGNISHVKYRTLK